MIPKVLEKWNGYYDPTIEYLTLGFKTKSAAKRFLRAKGATAGDWLVKGGYRYKDGRAVRLFEAFLDREYPWQVHEEQK